jgi:hypothetical protein
MPGEDKAIVWEIGKMIGMLLIGDGYVEHSEKGLPGSNAIL